MDQIIGMDISNGADVSAITIICKMCATIIDQQVIKINDDTVIVPIKLKCPMCGWEHKNISIIRE
jgi:hypothetical protein